MKQMYTFLIALISVLVLSTNMIAQQSDAAPALNDQIQSEVQMKAAKAAEKELKSSLTESVPSPEDLMQQKIIFRQAAMNNLSSFQTKANPPQINSPSVKATGTKDSFCSPIYSTGCAEGDGFTDFAVEQIQNLGSGCANNTGSLGWSEYYSLGPAILIPGMVYTFTMATGFSSQHVNIWIDFNDDLTLTADEMILQDFVMTASGTLYDVDVTIPATATPGIHGMRAMANYYTAFTDPCGSYTYGEAEDYTVNIGVPAYGDLEGYVTELGSGNPIQGAEVVAGGFGPVTTDATGYYIIEDVLTGDWNATASKAFYQPQTVTVTIVENQTTQQNFQLEAPGSVEGTVTELSSGNPIQGAAIDLGNGSYTTTSAADGTYSFDPVLTGTYDITCTMDGYVPEMTSITVTEDNVTTQDFMMTAPTMEVSPAAINVTLDPNTQDLDFLDISNNGNGALDWSASLEYVSDATDDAWDLQFQFDVEAATGALGNAGAECDGQYYYTTRWASNLIHKYDLTGTMLEEFSIPGVSGLRDLAYDGTYMYGGAAAGVIYEMDFPSHTLISSISNSGQARSIAYDSDNDAFWISNFGSDVWLISKAGATLNTIPNGNLGLAGMYGSAYDNTSGTPYLWIFDQGAGGGTAQLIHQVDLTTLMPTGFTYDVMNDLGPNASGIAGGLFMVDNIYPGTWSMGGLLQGTPDVFFMYEFAPAGALWLTISPNSGNIDPGNMETMTLSFDATDIVPGTVKTANIYFTSSPDVGSITVPVSMTVGNLQFGHITGNVTLSGSLPYNIGDVTEVIVQAGPYFDNPDASGNYDITAYPGTYDVVASLYGYDTTTTSNITVVENGTVNLNITMPTLFGSISGTVTAATGGAPVNGATVELVGTDLDTITAADGTYEIVVVEGTYDVNVSAPFFAPQTATGVLINANATTTIDFQLAEPDFSVTPTTITDTLEPNETGMKILTLGNGGSVAVDWSASLVVASDDDAGKDAWDLQFQFDVEAATGALGNAGAECDGQYYYSTRWASNLIHKYDLTGTMLEEFSIPGVSGLRDLAYDGTYMYGGAAAGVIYEMDFASQTLVSSISNAGQARSIAYDSDNDAFWISNFGSDVWLIDKTGATLNTIPNGNLGLAGMYGSAFENITGTPYLWIFDQGAGGGTAQLIHQVDLTTLMPTGFTYDVMNDLGPNASAIAGGLFMVDNVYSGTWSIGGLLQGTPDVFFMYEFAPAANWVSISSNSGTLAAGATETMDVNFDATDLLPGIYEAEIHFTTEPDAGSPIVPVTLTVEGLIPPINMAMDWDCTDVMVDWEMPTGGNPNSWNVYRDGTLIGNTTTMEYTDEMVDPEVDYEYHVTAVYGGDESMGTTPQTMNVPMPEDMAPTNLALEFNGIDWEVMLTWDVPMCCVGPMEYNIYRDNVLIGTSSGTSYSDGAVTPGFFEYYVTGVYYFGESDPSDPGYVLVGVNEAVGQGFEIFPNPASDYISVKSDYFITNYEVLNNVGQLVRSENVNAGNFKIDVAKLERGIYYIKLFTEDGVTLRKIAIE